MQFQCSEIMLLSPAQTTSMVRDRGTGSAPMLVPDVLSPADCDALVAEMIAYPPEPTLVLRAGNDDYEPSVRTSDSCTPRGPMRARALALIEGAARTHWPAHHGDAGVISAAHYFRYRTGGFVGPHRDRSTNNDDPREIRWRMASLVLFLNSDAPPDGFDGGALVVYVPQISGPTIPHTIHARAGMLTLFDPGLVHEVTRVRSGTRYTVVAWLIASRLSPSAHLRF